MDPSSTPLYQVVPSPSSPVCEGHRGVYPSPVPVNLPQTLVYPNNDGNVVTVNVQESALVSEFGKLIIDRSARVKNLIEVYHNEVISRPGASIEVHVLKEEINCLRSNLATYSHNFSKLLVQFVALAKCVPRTAALDTVIKSLKELHVRSQDQDLAIKVTGTNQQGPSTGQSEFVENMATVEQIKHVRQMISSLRTDFANLTGLVGLLDTKNHSSDPTSLGTIESLKESIGSLSENILRVESKVCSIERNARRRATAASKRVTEAAAKFNQTR